MGFRFQKRIKIAPGIRLNVSKGGVSLSAGARGASVSVSKRGIYGNASIPGTGISFREKLNKTGNNNKAGRHNTNSVNQGNILISIDDDGQLALLYPSGEPMSAKDTAIIRKQANLRIRAFMEEVCEQRNEMLRSLDTLHHRIPKPTSEPEYDPLPFKIPQPKPSFFEKLWALIFPPYRRALEHKKDTWHQSKSAHDEVELERKTLEEKLVFTNIDAMTQVLETYLEEIEWPVEPIIDFDLGDNNKTLALDIKFPDERGIPDKEWSVPATQYKLNQKKVSESRRRMIYRDYIHSVMMRVTGEIFAHLPTVKHVLISGYRDSINPSSGNEEEQYIISVIIDREKWTSMNFSKLRQIEPVEVFTGHLLKRSMTKTGVFKAIEPYTTRELEETDFGEQKNYK